MWTATLSDGRAPLTVSELSRGTHAITASYNGNGSFLASRSPALTQTVQAAPTTVTLVSNIPVSR